MQPENPYSAPKSQVELNSAQQQATGHTDSVAFSAAAMQALHTTKAWLKFIGITLILIAVTSIALILAMYDIRLLNNATNLMLTIITIATALPVVTAIIVFYFNTRAKRYASQQSEEAFTKLASSHQTLYATMSSACILFALGVIILIYLLIAQLENEFIGSKDIQTPNHHPTTAHTGSL